MYINYYSSPLGKITLTSDGININGLWFEENNYPTELNLYTEKSLPIFDITKNWLDIYFSGENPDFLPRISLSGTQFETEVWGDLQKIPYGKTTTYGNIAKKIAKKRGLEKMSSQAVGNAIRKNKILIIIPCHRVIGTNGKLVGYSAGTDKKLALLNIERNNKMFK